MRKILMALTVLSCSYIIGCGPIEESESPNPADGTESISSDITNCQYKVTWPTAGVYEQPSNGSTLLKKKAAGDIVGGYCDWTYFNSAEGNVYLAVSTASAEDGIGWMRRDALVKF